MVIDVVSRQRRRLIASILGYAEREFYPDLTAEQQAGFRAKVLGSVGVFADLMIDMLRSANEGYWINDEAMTLLADINSQIQNLRAPDELDQE